MQQYVTRTMTVVRIRCYKITGIGEDGAPKSDCLLDDEVVVTRMNDQVARDHVRESGIDPRGKHIVWEIVRTDTYGMTVEDFFAMAVQVDRAANGLVTVS